jgi:hypothetical protein
VEAAGGQAKVAAAGLGGDTDFSPLPHPAATRAMAARAPTNARFT